MGYSTSHESVQDCVLYTYPFMSCERCFVHMVQAGIVRFVAPKSPVDKLERWAAAFAKVRGYATEMGIEISEYDSTDIT